MVWRPMVWRPMVWHGSHAFAESQGTCEEEAPQRQASKETVIVAQSPDEVLAHCIARMSFRVIGLAALVTFSQALSVHQLRSHGSSAASKADAPDSIVIDKSHGAVLSCSELARKGM